LSYLAHVTTGDLELGHDEDDDKEVGLKLSIQPHDSVYLSASAMRTGALGSEENLAYAAFGWGGTHPYPVSYEGTKTLNNVTAWEVDARLDVGESLELWLAYGDVDIEDGVDSADDRDFQYMILQAVADGNILGNVPQWVASSYAVVRYSEIGTYDSGAGYKFVAVNGGEDFGFETEQVSSIQLGLGHHVSQNVKIVLEYDSYDFELTEGTARHIGSQHAVAGSRGAVLVQGPIPIQE